MESEDIRADKRDQLNEEILRMKETYGLEDELSDDSCED